jgi:hypothetical protein
LCYLLGLEPKILTELKEKNKKDGEVDALPAFPIVLISSGRVQEACRNLIVLK